MEPPESRIAYLQAQVRTRELRIDDLNREITRLKGGRPLNAAKLSEFQFGVKMLAEYLLKSAVDERHQGEVSCDDILEAAEGLGVNIKKETWC